MEDGMVLEAVIYTLIYIAVAALVVWLIIWVLQSIGVPLPPQALKILWVIFGLICILLLLRLILPMGVRMP
jgi:hypothetical protein